MKARFLGIAIACLLVGVSAHASSLSGFGSYWDSDDLDTGYGAGGSLTAELLPILALDIRGSWINFDDADVAIIPVEAALFLQIPGDNIVPFAGVGVGYYFFDPDTGSADDEVGYFGAAGVKVMLDESVGIFGEARWVVLEADVDDALASAEDLDDKKADLDGFGVNAGVILNW